MFWMMLIPVVIAFGAAAATVFYHRRRRAAFGLSGAASQKKEPVITGENRATQEEAPKGAEASAAPSPPSPPISLITLRILAKEGQPYVGYELLQAILSVGLRFGRMNIFHRYEHASGRGALLFSLASATEPGTFELSKMGGVSTPGLTLFMRIADQPDPVQAFDLMLETARQLMDDLGGRWVDAQLEPLTEAAIKAHRVRVRAYVERKMTVDMFDE